MHGDEEDAACHLVSVCLGTAQKVCLTFRILA